MRDNSISDQLMKLFDQLKVYLNLRIDHVKLHIAEYMIKFFSAIILWMVLFWFSFFVVVFSSFAFAYWFGDKTGKWALGFLIVALFYVVMAIFIFAFRRAILVRPFTRLILHQMELDKFKDPEDEEE